MKIGQNTEKSPGDSRILAVSQTPAKINRLTWCENLLKEYDNNNNNNYDREEEDSVDTSIQRLEDYIEKYERGLITAIRNNTANTIDNRMTITRKQKWEGKTTLWAF